MAQLIPFVGYAPDIDPQTPGVITNCSAIVPTIRGFMGAPSPVVQGVDTLVSPCKGAASVRKLDDNTRIFAGTRDTLYELSGTNWNDISGVGSSGLGITDRWRFAQFGDATVFAAKTEVTQFITTGTATSYAGTSTAPNGAVVETVNNFVFLFDVIDQGSIYDSAERPHGWWCAGKGGYTSWVPDVTTEAATGVLSSTPGKVVGAKRFGYQIIAYKLRAMYVGTYVGQPQIWDFKLIPGEAGALSHEVIVNIGTPEQPKHIFMGFDNFYSFDGGNPVPIGNELRKTVFGELNYEFYYGATALHDRTNKLVYFYYPVSPSVSVDVGESPIDFVFPDRCVVYNYETGKWGRDDRQIQATIDYLGTGITYDEVGSSYSNFDDLPNEAYDFAFSVVGSENPAIFNTDSNIAVLNGPSVSSSISTGDYGDDQGFSTLSRIRPRFLTAPNSSVFTNYYRNTLSDSLTIDQSTSMNSGRFDVIRSARWHRGIFDMIGPHEITGFSADTQADGEE